MATQADLDDVFQKLKEQGLRGEHEGQLISLVVNRQPGVARTYVVELTNGDLSVMLTTLEFDDEGEDHEEDFDLGTFATSDEAVEAVIDSENEF